MDDLYLQSVDSSHGHRVMVIGQEVITVQRVSRYCLKQGAEVFPYYGIPSTEEISLFDPQVLVLCPPLSEEFFQKINYPYVLWSEQHSDLHLITAQKHLN